MKNERKMLKLCRGMRIRAVKSHLQGAPAALNSTAASDVNSSRKGQRPKAVIFDMGGVLIPSPIHGFLDYERAQKLPKRTIAETILASGPDSAWPRLETGDLTIYTFVKPFGEEISKRVGYPVDMSGVIDALALKDTGMFPEMLEAVKCIRAEGIKTAVLTNNFKATETQSLFGLDRNLFDVVIESCLVKMRKPDPRIFQLTLERLEVQPEEAVFLDDLGVNLKAARQLGIRTIKVGDPAKAVSDLSQEIGFDCRKYAEGTTSVPERLQIPIGNLKNYLDTTLSITSTETPVVRCYEHGQSNPTYFVHYAGKDMVLRKKPPGKLLPSAHAVEREYRVMKAVGTQGVPVPKMLALCEDSSVIGTPFYIMSHVPGIIYKDPLLSDKTPEERRAIYDAMNEVLTKIHKVDIKAAGLEDYGKTGNYMQRNFKRWAKQYEASKTHEILSMDRLMEWLPKHMPDKEACTVVHGDFRLDNLIFHPDRPEVLAVLDWELSTLGDPISDLATNCLPYYTPPGARPPFAGISQIPAEHGIPSGEEYLASYARRMGIPPIHNWDFYLVFILFRFAAILQGVYKRFKMGQASSSSAEQAGLAAETLGELAWHIASNSKLTGGAPVAPAGSAVGDLGKRLYSTSSTSTNYFNMASTKKKKVPTATLR